jgi:predicted nucleotidyltransferase component of viral defense system
MLSAAQLAREAAVSGFRPESVEKVARLLELLVGLRSHPYLKSRMALKGGTALNLFVLDVPRLSVDIDLNIVGADTREVMLAERPLVERAVDAVCGRLGLQVQRTAGEHAGGKWRLSHTSSVGRPSTLEVDLNFLMRAPLWPVVWSDSRGVGSLQARQVPLVDVHELAAGKLAALFDRSASRDLFDVVELLRRGQLDHERLRLAFVVYGGASRRDWRTLSVEDVTADPREVDRSLLPMLRADLVPRPSGLSQWVESLVAECRRRLEAVLPFAENELEFLMRLNREGRICPELLTAESGLHDIVARHPALLWKAQNVRAHVGHAGSEPQELGEPQTVEE